MGEAIIEVFDNVIMHDLIIKGWDDRMIEGFVYKKSPKKFDIGLIKSMI
jgi:hypothetical protein